MSYVQSTDIETMLKGIVHEVRLLETISLLVKRTLDIELKEELSVIVIFARYDFLGPQSTISDPFRKIHSSAWVLLQYSVYI